MEPIAFNIFGLTIRWYGILISIGMMVGIILANYTCKLKDVDYDEFLNIVLISFPIAIIGARAYYVIFEFNQYKDNLIEVFNTRQGGLAIHGGIIFGMIAALIYTRYKKENLLEFVDVAAPSIIIAQAIGRWGNFFNSEAHGGPVTQGFISKFPDFIQNGMLIEGVYYHPTFLYESVWNVMVGLLLIYLLTKTLKRGTVFFSYIGLYSLGRFFIEGLRTDSLMFGDLRVAQLISLVGIALWVIFLAINCKRRDSCH
ncbi:prolipoprotein diacylglyceryl transferase [Clostridium sp. CM028]|uniref:prolipoprotein diacylglyceryl transferase n=1 Tax=unclassified Clostridium TaxID=2614128 RepID=UPI001C6DE7F2|nr:MULTISPECIES: prolipoprotein diacylglyceryl transferase [unclassified Clostridium]MBW9147059.1 prolipoprotein diacylglyceryl transferase [Clostridium sp. CM027]MBW9150456.1 prolipoprotein diacylglyceryl transferase [Clostridium sp. CM028]UVE39976.1 prolipoprotein diacylglyceryl transferase [Clostridium sp. CM027]WLC60666.1 prolipoprotein diacylglyceryl transferase [Clostridium sp. CM028]